MIRLWYSKGSHPRTKDESSSFSTPGLIALETADQLLQTPHRHTFLQRISRLISLPQQHFSRFVQPLFHNYARFVQQLPASEVHHHAGLGGMIDHGLEVAAKALQIRRGHLLPQGAEPEIIAKKQDLWSYATLTGALLHDLGKPAVDQKVTLYNASGKRLGPWDPWTGPMDLINDCTGYRVEFVPKRQYKLHERVAPLLAHHIVPPCGLSWLASDTEVLTVWLATLAGDHENAGILGQIIGQADRESVAQNLGASDEVRPPTTRVKPLHEKLLTGLRYLLSEDELPLNRNGAAGWLIGNDLWLVSKRTVDALRTHLTTEGHSGIPHSNDRLFDVLQEQGVLIPCGERAIWRAEVSGDGWSHELTLLRIPVQKIWPNSDARPDPFSGTVTPLENKKDIEVRSKIPAPQEAVSPAVPSPTLFSMPASALSRKALTQDLAQECPEIDDGESFLIWLREELVSGRMEVNTVKARVHIVSEGILLISPGIFKDFAARHPDTEGWNAVQKRFQKLKVHCKTPNGTNIHRYRVQGARRRSTLNGLLIPDFSVIYGNTQAPEPNPVLVPMI